MLKIKNTKARIIPVDANMDMPMKIVLGIFKSFSSVIVLSFGGFLPIK